jgi:hypothetical protein
MAPSERDPGNSVASQPGQPRSAGVAPTSRHRQPDRRRHWTRLLHRRLLVRVVAPGVLGLLLGALAIADLVRGQVPWTVLLWVLPGLVLGYAIGRLTRVAWDSEAGQLVQSGGGLVVLMAYLMVRFGEGFVLSPRFFDWPYISNAAALVAVGLLFGRVIGVRGAILRALDDPDLD